ncbi:DoxX family protein [Thermogemmatispora onikobensis]|uniref:DoxX family protein n=1 Tax=Thermogemmatispora onikobensis TaxID=732234 RepID=UPI0008529420|nr:DoxX family protein [Thermogemmatispora onikobensis]
MSNWFLWIVQSLLALAFLTAGIMKSVRPLEQLKQSMAWVGRVPPMLVRFIGICELLGAIGLVLPLATGILPGLTVAAASGLALIMIFAAIFHARQGEYREIGLNLILLLLALVVALGRLPSAHF